LNSHIFENIFIQLAAGDAGGSLGAALAAYYLYYGKDRKVAESFDDIPGSYLGPEFSDLDIIKTA